MAAGGLVEQLRAVKDDEELKLMRRAAEITDGLYRWLIDEHGLAGHTEVAVARARAASSGRGRRRGRVPDSGRPRTARCRTRCQGRRDSRRHAGRGRSGLHRGGLLLGLHAHPRDGDPGAEATGVYELVQSAQAAASAAVTAGAEAKAVDAAARDEIERAERATCSGTAPATAWARGPRSAAGRSKGRHEAGRKRRRDHRARGLRSGEFGVRIEDMVLVTTDGADSFTALPHELITVRAAKYQHLEGVPMDWLRGACSALR